MPSTVYLVDTDQKQYRYFKHLKKLHDERYEGYLQRVGKLFDREDAVLDVFRTLVAQGWNESEAATMALSDWAIVPYSDALKTYPEIIDNLG